MKKQTHPLPTKMLRETAQAPQAVAGQLEQNKHLCTELAARFADAPPRLIATCARGSSDHAAAYGKYLMESTLGIPVMSAAPSMGAVYARPMDLRDSLFVIISQSGKSPDLVANAAWARQNGAFVLALLNREDSPAGKEAHAVLPLHAGPELSVAATKSYICSLSALLHLTAGMARDPALSKTLNNALQRLPQDLESAHGLSWSPAIEPFADAQTLFVIGRGLSYGVALEAALKLKETTAIHAEGISGAEIMHGPLALVRRRSRVLVFSQEDETRHGLLELAQVLRGKGAKLFMAEEGAPQIGRLPILPGLHPATAPITMIQSFYGLANSLALARGLDPDNPPSLQKVTETL